MVHSDQGFQYQHRSWRALLSDDGAVLRTGAPDTQLSGHIGSYDHERVSTKLKVMSLVQYRARALAA